MWLGAHPVAGAPDPRADGGGAGSSPTVACREPPGLRRPQAGHPATRRPKSRSALSAPPLRGTWGQRPTIRDGSAAPGRLPQVAHGRAPRRRGSNRPGGAGAIRRPTTPANGRVGPVPPPDVAGTGHPAGGGLSGGVPRGRRAPASSLSLSLPSSLPSPSLSRPIPAPRSRVPVAPRAPPQSGNGQADPLLILLPLGRR